MSLYVWSLPARALFAAASARSANEARARLLNGDKVLSPETVELIQFSAPSAFASRTLKSQVAAPPLVGGERNRFTFQERRR